MTAKQFIAIGMLTVALAGCGGSSSSPSSSPSAYRDAVNKICAADNAKIKALPASTTNSVAGLQKLLSIELRAVSQVKALRPPSSISTQVNTWLATVSQTASNATQLLGAVQSGDKPKTQALASQAQTLNTQTNSQARALGLTSCAQNSQPSGR